MPSLDLAFRSFTEWVIRLPLELAASLLDPGVWLAFVAAILVLATAASLGSAVVHMFRLVPRHVPCYEQAAIVLSVGIIVLVSGWATVRSGGGSAFTPVTLAMGAATLVLLLDRRRVPRETPQDATTAAPSHRVPRPRGTWWLVGAAVLAAGLMYGSTMAPSPRDGLQPVEFMDEAYYAVLAANLAETGVESVYVASGLPAPDGVPTQGWYHWGEPWLAAFAIWSLGVAPIFALCYVALPILIVCIALLGATLVRRLTGLESQGVAALSAVATVLLAPIPTLGFFGSWARGAIFGVTTYGLALVILLLLLCIVASHRPWLASRAHVLLTAAVATSVTPAHIVLAIVTAAGVGAAVLVGVATRLLAGRGATLRPEVVATVVATSALATVTIAYGMWTGHALVGGAASAAPAFGLAWPEGMLLTTLGAGVLLILPVAWFLESRRPSIVSDLFVLATAAVAAGALAWGLRVGDFNMFHFFYAPIVALATPLAIVAVWRLVGRARASRRNLVAAALTSALLLQTGVGAVSGIERLRSHGPRLYNPIPTAVLAAIRQLPEDAKLAYSCNPFEEVGYHEPMLLAITAHTGRNVVPLCFQADWLRGLHAQPLSEETPSPFFELAPQRSLYPTPTAVPRVLAILQFLQRMGIRYMYVDGAHPEPVVPGGKVLFAVGDTILLEVP